MKTSFDSLGRAVKTSLVVDGNPTPPGTGPWGGILPNDITADTVIEQTLLSYDDASNVISTTGRRRFHNATGTGDLQGPGGTEPKSRDTFVASWPDSIGRPVTTANYGTNGGSTFTRPDTAPAASDTILVSVTAYNEAGEPWQSTAPDGIIYRVIRDAASRTIETIENYTTTGGGPDANRTTLSTYTPGGQPQTLTLVNPDTGHQTTTWTYGTTLADSGIASGALLQTKTFPNGDASSYTYNRQGQPATHTDANGTVHVLDYDVMGRSIHDSIASLASGVDGTIRRLSRGYNERGQLATASSATDPTPGQGTIANQVAFTYDAFGQLTADKQEHTGTVDTNTPEVTYAYENGSTGTIRRTGMTYPDERQLDYTYGAASSNDDTLNRISEITLNGEATSAVSYQYMGRSTTAKIDLPEPGVVWNCYQAGSTGSGGDPYIAYDRFGRLVDKHWAKTSTTINHLTYGYDRASRRLWKQEAAGTAQDNLYTYDALGQVHEAGLGTLNAGKNGLTGTPVREEDFTYDPTGNWNAYDQLQNGTQDINQTRINNTANQFIAIDGNYTGITYDGNGNITQAPTGANLQGSPHTLKWDAWNRLVQVKDENGTTIQTNQYDALHRRTRVEPEQQNYVDLYYNDQWRLVQSLDEEALQRESYLWGTSRWECIRRDLDDLDANTSQRHYVLSDAMDPVTITDEEGAVKERYRYTAFGRVQYLEPDFSVRNSSAYHWPLLFHHEFQDQTTDWHNYGYRFYAPEQGRWLSRDPIGEEGGVNLYGFVGNESINSFDVMGLISLSKKLIGYYVARASKAWIGSLIGDWAYNHNAENNHIDFQDDEDEMNAITTMVRMEVIKAWVCSQKLSYEWVKHSLSQSTDSAKTNSMDSTLEWLLWKSGHVTSEGNVEARCKSRDPLVACVRERDLTWVWHDEMDANSASEGGALRRTPKIGPEAKL